MMVWTLVIITNNWNKYIIWIHKTYLCIMLKKIKHIT